MEISPTTSLTFLTGSDDLTQVPARLAHQAAALGDLADAVVNEILDLLGRRGAALGEAAHLAGDHGEPAALFAGARRLDARR